MHLTIKYRLLREGAIVLTDGHFLSNLMQPEIRGGAPRR